MSVPEPTRHILDGGALLHRMPWQHGTRYCKRTKSYSDFTGIVAQKLRLTLMATRKGHPLTRHASESMRTQYSYIISFTAEKKMSQARRKSSFPVTQTTTGMLLLKIMLSLSYSSTMHMDKVRAYISDQTSVKLMAVYHINRLNHDMCSQ